MARARVGMTEFERCWRSSGLRLIHWSVYDSAKPVRAERRKARQHWMLYALIVGKARLHLPTASLELEAPCLALLRPQRAFLEDLEPAEGRILLATIDLEVLTLPGWGDPLRLLPQPVCRRPADLSRVLELVRGLQGLRPAAVEGRLRARGLVDLLLSELLVAGAVWTIPVPERPLPVWLVDAREACAARWSDPQLDLAAMAQEAGVDRSRFCREFRKAYGLPPMAWLRRERMTCACRQLRHCPERPIAEVARACGYASPVRFSRHFQAVCGMAPRRWRTAALGGGAAAEG